MLLAALGAYFALVLAFIGFEIHSEAKRQAAWEDECWRWFRGRRP